MTKKVIVLFIMYGVYRSYTFCRTEGVNKTNNPLMLKRSSKNCRLDQNMFDNTFGIESDFTKYLKESCW